MTYTAADFATLQAEKNAAVAAQAIANGARCALEQEVAELRAALKAVEAHHAKLNRKRGRPENRSTTLLIVREALARAGAAPTPAGEPVSGQPSDMSAAREPSPITS